jgi:hypothetical protein
VNKTTAIFLINDQVRCVAVAYDQIKSGSKSIPTEIRSFKTLDPNIAVDDLVVIPTDTRWGFTVGKVTDVDLHVDFDSPEQMRWIQSKIDPAEYKGIIAQEAAAMDSVADADREARRKKLAAELLANSPNLGDNALFRLGSEAPAPAPKGDESDVSSGRGGAQ